MRTDAIVIKNLRVEGVTVGLDRWHRDEPQPVLVSLRVLAADPIARTAETDDISGAVNYVHVRTEITQLAGLAVTDIDELACEMVHRLMRYGSGKFEIRLPAAMTVFETGAGAGAGITLHGHLEWPLGVGRKVTVAGLALRCIVGVGAHERREKQTVLVDLTLEGARRCRDWADHLSPIVTAAEESSFQTVETLAVSLAEQMLGLGWDGAGVCVIKPHAWVDADGPGVMVYRRQQT